jgi:hypothetical protein
LFRQTSLSAQPAKRYRAWMNFARSFTIWRTVGVGVGPEERDDFPKSDRVGAGLRRCWKFSF